MTTVGFIGSGRIGSTVARLSVAAGHPVMMSNSRGPATLQDLVGELGPLARAGTPVYGTVYGSFDNETGTPASAASVRAALAIATR
jgi:8-hydroxy-5-deazaflavin:NADPH oxidoreductase